MERRVLLAIFLAFIVLYTWQAIFVKPVPKPVTGSAPASSTESAAGTATPATAAGSPDAPAALAAVAKPAAPLATALVAETTERDVRVETRDIIAVFTNKGARLKSFRLKHYPDQQKQPQELVERDLPSQPLPFTLRAANDATTATLN